MCLAPEMLPHSFFEKYTQIVIKKIVLFCGAYGEGRIDACTIYMPPTFPPTHTLLLPPSLALRLHLL